MAFSEDISFFLDPVNGFAQEATVGGASVVGIYNSGFGAMLGVESEVPSFTCSTDDLPDQTEDDTVVVVIEGAFKVSERQDNEGVTTLMLHSDEE